MSEQAGEQAGEQAEQTGGAGRYSRSSTGLIGAMLVTVVVVVGFVLFRSVFSRDLEVAPEPVDYLDTVYAVQQAGFTPIYPPALPEGWIATSVAFDPGDRPAFGISLRTDDGSFVGIRQEDASADDLLETYVDPDDVAAEDPFEVTGSVAPRWDGWSDPGGDRAYTAEVGDDTVVVFGSASAAEIEGVVEMLTDEAAPDPASASPTSASPATARPTSAR